MTKLAVGSAITLSRSEIARLATPLGRKVAASSRTAVAKEIGVPLYTLSPILNLRATAQMPREWIDKLGAALKIDTKGWGS